MDARVVKDEHENTGVVVVVVVILLHATHSQQEHAQETPTCKKQLDDQGDWHGEAGGQRLQEEKEHQPPFTRGMSKKHIR